MFKSHLDNSIIIARCYWVRKTFYENADKMFSNQRTICHCRNEEVCCFLQQSQGIKKN